MSKQLLDKAHDLILRQDYDAARDILRPLAEPQHDGAALATKLDECRQRPRDDGRPIDEQMQAEREALDKIVDVMKRGRTERAERMCTGARHDVMGVPVTITDVDDEEEVPAAGCTGPITKCTDGDDDLLPPDEFGAQSVSPAEDINEMPVTITDVDEMPIDELAGCCRPGPFRFTGEVQWEYREVVLHDWGRHMDNVEAALEDNGDSEHVTVEDTYTQQLNAAGAAGWEVVSEQVLPEQRVRLLMKRRKPAMTTFRRRGHVADSLLSDWPILAVLAANVIVTHNRITAPSPGMNDFLSRWEGRGHFGRMG